jgi:chemotaxis protein CheD
MITVGIGRMGFACDRELLQTLGLGSCLAIVLFAPQQGAVALAHCMLPERAGDDGEPASKFADSAVAALHTLMSDAGAPPRAAALVGGASMFPGVPTEFVREIAGNNIRAARASLAAASIPVRVEDVGGHVGRSVLVDPVTQRIMVRTIRDGDRWL